MAALAQTLNDLFLIGKAGLAQLAERGEEAVIPRLSERIRREQGRSEQQRLEPPQVNLPGSSTGPMPAATGADRGAASTSLFVVLSRADLRLRVVIAVSVTQSASMSLLPGRWSFEGA